MLFRTLLVWRAWAELLRYDLTFSVFGFQGVYRGLERLEVSRKGDVNPDQICSALAAAMVLYWKPVRCLQQAMVTASLLRRMGWNGRLVIGYRADPFCSHAWVELDGFPLAGSHAFQERLHMLATI